MFICHLLRDLPHLQKAPKRISESVMETSFDEDHGQSRLVGEPQVHTDSQGGGKKDEMANSIAMRRVLN